MVVKFPFVVLFIDKSSGHDVGGGARYLRNSLVHQNGVLLGSGEAIEAMKIIGTRFGTPHSRSHESPRDTPRGARTDTPIYLNISASIRVSDDGFSEHFFFRKDEDNCVIAHHGIGNWCQVVGER